MNKVQIPKYALPLLCLLLTLSTLAQSNKTPEPDDEFNVFLLTLATIFVCAMIGAAIVGSFAAAVFFLSLLALISIGVVSASVAVGLYKRSLAAGFKTLLMIVFGVGCAVCGTALSLVLHHFYPAQVSFQAALLAGTVAGAFGGIIMGLSTFTIIQTVLWNLSRRLTAAA